jgi:hypothetical protein
MSGEIDYDLIAARAHVEAREASAKHPHLTPSQRREAHRRLNEARAHLRAVTKHEED